MRFTVTLECENAAFDHAPGREVARILEECAKRARRGEVEGSVRDVNGNRVGRFGYDATREDA